MQLLLLAFRCFRFHHETKERQIVKPPAPNELWIDALILGLFKALIISSFQDPWPGYSVLGVHHKQALAGHALTQCHTIVEPIEFLLFPDNEWTALLFRHTVMKQHNCTARSGAFEKDAMTILVVISWIYNLHGCRYHRRGFRKSHSLANCNKPVTIPLDL